MKKFVLVFTSLFVYSLCLAADLDYDYKNLIGKLDVADEVKTIEKNSPNLFWGKMVDYNESFKQFIIDMKKNWLPEKEALRKSANIPRFYPQYDESVIESAKPYCDSIFNTMGVSDLDVNCSLHIIYSDDINAYTVLTEDGFAICITSALFTKKGINDNIIRGYIAHELVHGLLQHHTRRIYEVAKKKRKNQLIAGIISGLYVFSETYNSVRYDASNQDYLYDYSFWIENLNNKSKISTLKYAFKYSREQEYEADLIAFRFMEYQGLGEEFLNGLRILGTEYDDLFDDFNDHPTIISRINFLKYALDNPSLGNTINKKIIRKREFENDEW